jgi:hypothetical protein
MGLIAGLEQALASTAIVQFLSRGKRSQQVEMHVSDAGVQAGDRRLAIRLGFVDRLHRQSHAFVVLQVQPAYGLQDATRIGLRRPSVSPNAPYPEYGELVADALGV